MRFQNVSCQLSFDDEAPESKSNALSLSREHNKMADSSTISPQLLILSKLEFRKLFLLLSYAKRLVLILSVMLSGTFIVSQLEKKKKP